MSTSRMPAICLQGIAGLASRNPVLISNGSPLELRAWISRERLLLTLASDALKARNVSR